MRKLLLFIVCLLPIAALAQHMPHGTIYGRKPNRVGLIKAEKLEAWLSKRPSVSVTVQGRVTAVTKSRGGWFTMDAGRGHTIEAHFKPTGINLPASLKGKTVIIEGVVKKQITADNMQHFAGEKGADARQYGTNNQQLLFDVIGLEVIR